MSGPSLPADSQRESAFKSIVRYAASNLYRQVLGLITAILRPKLLTPEVYGLWNLLTVIHNYATYAHLGSRTAMRYRIPLLEAQKNHAEIEPVTASVFYGSLGLNLLFALGVVLATWIPNLTTPERIGLMITAGTVITSWYYEYLISLLKGYQDFRSVSAANVVRASSLFIFTLCLIWFFGLYGALMALPLATMATLLYLRRVQHFPALNGFDKQAFVQLVRSGFPIMIFNLAGTLLRSVDKIVIAFFLGNRLLGFYGIATMVLGYLLSIPGVTREVTEGRLMEAIKDGVQPIHFHEYFLKPVLTSAFLMPFLIGPAFILLPVAIPILLPNYLAGIEPARLMVLGSFFLALSYPVRGIIVANNWQLKALFITVIPVLFDAVLSILFIKAGDGIVGVAVASCLSFFLLFLLLLGFVIRRFGIPVGQIRASLLILALSFPLMCAAIIGIEHWPLPMQSGAVSTALIKTGLLIVFSLVPLLLTARFGYTSLPRKISKLWRNSA
ncbi:MAG: oligosaccharide flippase family protein [Magnetococcales bacterium]|nr:oligosaccharide flippase family protein [Magnetococcales bacterium]